MTYRLLQEFEGLFKGHPYIHRDSSRGDWVAMHLYEDLVKLGKSSKLLDRAGSKEWVINTANKRQGINARRGDGTFGELVPGETAVTDPGFSVSRGRVATVEIGSEVKILAKAMIKQIDRVIGDLNKQVTEFGKGAGASRPICIAVVGVNHAPHTTGYEGERSYRTDGRKHKDPIQEADEATMRLNAQVRPNFDELIILPYEATNEEPFPFSWRNRTGTIQDYAAALVRVSREYDRRF